VVLVETDQPGPTSRALHSSTFRLDVSALCGVWGGIHGLFRE